MSLLSLLGDVRRVVAVAGAVHVFATAAIAGVLDDARSDVAEGRLADAEAVLTEALDTLSGDARAEALWLLARSASDPTVTDDALHRIRSDHAETPWAVSATRALADRAVLAGDLTQALGLFDELVATVASRGERERIQLKRAEVLLALGRTDALGGALQSLTQSPDEAIAARATLMEAMSAYRNGLFGDALETAVSLLDMPGEKETAGALMWAARALLARGEAPLAAEYLDQLGREYPDTVEGALARALSDSLAARERVTQPEAASDTLALGEASDSEDVAPLAIPIPDRTPAQEAVHYVVYLGRYADRLDAHRALTDLHDRGRETASVVREEEDHETVFRIRLGSFEDDAHAAAAQREAEDILGVSGVVREEF